MPPATQLSKEEAVRLLRNGLAEQFRDLAASYVMPICWITAENGRPKLIDNGSAFMIDCGEGPFLVTAHHVYEGFRAARRSYPDAVCMLGDLRFDPEHRYIASDAAYDVATFRIEAQEIRQLKNYTNGKVVLTGSQQSWPPAPPQLDRGVFFVGFPGDGRKLMPYRGGSLVEVEWTGYTALAVANGVSDTDVTLVFEHDPEFDVEGRRVPPGDWALGGCSGAPVLALVEDRGVFSWRLGGIIYEAGSSILKAARADCLNPDGSLNPYPNPMAYKGRQW